VIVSYERLGLLRSIDAGWPIEDVYEDARRLLITLSGNCVSPARKTLRG
jgi:hypothetical protein